MVGEISSLTLAERAAALWYSMIKRFERLLAANPGMRTLDANMLFDMPAETIAAASKLLDAGIDANKASNYCKWKAVLDLFEKSGRAIRPRTADRAARGGQEAAFFRVA